MNPFDIEIFRFINAFAGIGEDIDRIIIFLAGNFIYFFVLAVITIPAVSFLWARYSGHLAKSKELLLSVLVSVFISRLVLTELIRLFFYRPRPFDAADILAKSQIYITQLILHSSGGSFPSGHASFAFALAGTVYYFYPRIGILFIIGASINGIARVAAGVHWFTDVLGGAILGFAVSWAVCASWDKLKSLRTGLT